MKMFALFVIGMVVGSSFVIAKDDGSEKKNSEAQSVFNFTMKTIDGKEKPLSDYKGDVLMIVNVASFCGYTPQYKDLEAVYEKYKARGFKILAFPANNFGSQEPGTNGEIKAFCTRNYNVTFDMFSKISVKGEDQDPLYHYLTTGTDFKGDIGWNFTKFLVDRNGNVVARYASNIVPSSKEITGKIEELLAVK
ncbi:MAG: glutathione peroxidase [Bacteroidota bacterium]|nr:glutathione peroxidase [Bacteroidota bacterium]